MVVSRPPGPLIVDPLCIGAGVTLRTMAHPEGVDPPAHWAESPYPEGVGDPGRLHFKLSGL